MKTFTKEHSREYSLFRVNTWYVSSIKGVKEIIDFSIDEMCMIYSGKGLVSGYYEPGSLKILFGKVIEKCQEKEYMKEEIKKFLKLFEELKPYFIGEKKPKNVEELKRIQELYSKYWAYVAVVFMIPTLPVDKELKKLAYDARALTQEHNEDMEKVIKECLEKWYPGIKGKTSFVLPEEVWKGEINKEKIAEREKGYIFYKGKVYTGNLEEWLKKLGIKLEEVKEEKELRGQIGYKGLVKGRVKIVSNVNDIPKVQEGDILVSTMTMPKYLPAMKKATAFVTDEGGITCHAAIVSREMKKPCIVGTKTATQILKDNDYIEVNANEGVIKKISNELTGEDLKDYKIINVGGRAVHYYIHYATGHMYSVKEHEWPLGVSVLILSHDNQARWNYLKRSDEDFDKYLDRFLEKPFLMKKLEKYINNTSSETVKKLDKNLSKISNKELIELHNYYFNQFENIMHTSGLLRFVDNALLKRLKDLYTEKALEIANISEKPSYALKEEIELLKGEDIKNIHKKYTWSTMGYFEEKPKSLEDYKKQLKEIKNPEKRLKEITEIQKRELEERKRFLKKVKKEDLPLFEIAAESTYLKDHLKFYTNRMIYYAEPLFKEIAKRTKKDIYFIKELLPEEVKDLLEGKEPDLNYIKERKENNVLFSEFGNFKVLTGEKALEFEKKYIQKEVKKELKGRIACKGYAKGKAKIIISSKDFHKIEKGDIIVVPNTSPDYVPILKKVAGIIAEEGGLTAHVSIVSREFNIPCIVGIENVTKIIKENTIIELDANKGIIKKC
jgi:phosphoenolpyruvate synthase/pyruvate phosphate dikinase